ncbi:acetate--CoA ligase family protein [Aeromicrobium sp. CF4.19]|uniref:acetate--CoA ligase family protein n=1 Tax=Aeromicrobium sp. CF4.19 TaxID=3373082 RepID=UPI003EE5565E
MSASLSAVGSALDPLLAPRGVVVIGASTEPTKLGGVMAQSLQSFSGHLALVNPRGGDGFHPDVASARAASPVPIDLAILCVPAAACAGAVRACAAEGVGAALVCAGGFAEAGDEGAGHHDDLVTAARESGVRLLGPNTSGFLVPRSGLTASFVPGVADVEDGSIGLVAASGGLNHALAFALQRQGSGLSVGVGIGAGVDVDAAEVVEHLAADTATTAIALHLETVRDGPRLLAAVRSATRVKPVVVLVVGQHDIGDFAASHTGALATSWRTTRSLLRQVGAVVVDDEQELVVAVSALSLARLDPIERAGVALVTGQAGPGLVIADTLHDNDVDLPALAPATRDGLANLLPPITFQANPVDTGRPGPQHGAVVATVASDPQVHLVAVYGLTEPVVDLPAVVDAADLGDVPAIVGIDGPQTEVEIGRTTAAKLGLPFTVGATALAQASAALVRDARAQHRGQGPQTTMTSIPADGGPWDEARAKDLLDAAGLTTPRRRLCRDRAEVLASLEVLSGPVVLKICDPDILHKSDVGGVRVGLRDVDELGSGLDAMASLGAGPWLVEEMSESGPELVVGARRDPVFGPVVVVGVGGTATEVYGDVAILGLPATDRQMDQMTSELAGRALIEGHRGSTSVAPAQVADVARRLGALLEANPHVVEIEVNPLRATPDGLVALDAVVITCPDQHADQEKRNR